jgi:hypothetical protein
MNTKKKIGGARKFSKTCWSNKHIMGANKISFVTDSHLNYRLRTVNPDSFNYPATNILADIIS